MKKSKVAIVTGGALGYKNGGPSIGGAVSVRLAQDGYKVIIVDILTAGKFTEEKILKDGGIAKFVKADVTKTEEIKKVIQITRSQFGGLNCLVNCVARYSKGMAKDVKSISEEEWNKTLEVNLGGYFKCCKYAIPLIIDSGGGTIVNISSGASFEAIPDFCVYNVSKAAIDGLTRSLAVDFAPKIRVNSICPGFVKIENSQKDRRGKELKEWYSKIAEKYPMNRVCEVEEISTVASFLASEESSFINGQSIRVDGGKSVADLHEF